MSNIIHFTKMHGAGNDYIYVNTTRYPIHHPELLARRWSPAHTGIGSDGLVLIGASDKADAPISTSPSLPMQMVQRPACAAMPHAASGNMSMNTD